MIAETDKTPTSLEAAYREMAADKLREREALEWAEALVGDVSEEPL